MKFRHYEKLNKSGKWIEINRDEYQKYFTWDDVENDNTGDGYYHQSQANNKLFKSGKGKYNVLTLGKRG